MLAATPTTLAETTSAEVRTKVLADYLRRVSRTEPNPVKAAALAAAASSVHAAQDRLTADFAQVDASVRRVPIVDLSPVTFGQLRVDRSSRQVTIDHAQVQLTRIQYSLLLVLISEPTRVFHKSELVRDAVPAAPPVRALLVRTCDDPAGWPLAQAQIEVSDRPS